MDYASLLPSQGWYCVGFLRDNGKFIHKFTKNIREALSMTTAPGNIYIAQAAFKEPTNRKSENAAFARAFWMDLDCGREKDPYKTQAEAIEALRDFVARTGLPAPCIINSGNGVYAHWGLTEDVLPAQWKGAARVLKQLAATLDFKTDPTRTADLSSVLRPVGAANYKDPLNPKPVVFIQEAEPTAFESFCAALHDAAKKYKLDVKTLETPKPASDLNSEFMQGLDGPPADANVVADACGQINAMRATGGDVPEPHWYAAIGLLRYCENGPLVIHEWSSGYAGYSFEETERKIQQHKVPPTTCAHFGQVNPGGCVGCKHNGKIKTPISLGRKTTQAPDAVLTPAGFVESDQGIFWTEENIRIYPYRIYPIQIAWDDSLQYETIRFRHLTAHDGWKEFVIRSASLHDPKALMMALADNHVQIVGATEKKLMLNYMESYAQKLRQTQKLATLYAQMGWRQEENDLAFVHGESLFRRGTPRADVGFAHNVPEVAKAYHTRGSLDAWVWSTRLLGRAGAEPYAFAFLAGVFGAPLMKFTGYEGAMVSCVGESGIGKTLVSMWIQSAYGNFRDLMLIHDDTKNSLIARLGVYGSLPVTIDEVSNIDKDALSELVYRITQGRDKNRLNRSGVERKGANKWSTIAIVSSNHSLLDRLSSAKADPTAEINRILELDMHPVPSWSREILTEQVHRVISQNYGLIAAPYIQYLVDNQDNHQEQIDAITRKLESHMGKHHGARFWLAVCATTLYGAVIAQRLGLIDFSLKETTQWVINLLCGATETKTEIAGSTTAVDMLAQFLMDNANRGVVVGAQDAVTALNDVHGALYWRFEIETHRLYISREALRNYMQGRKCSFVGMKKELFGLGILKQSDCRMNLARKVLRLVGAPQMCWEVAMDVPALCFVEDQLLGKQTAPPVIPKRPFNAKVPLTGSA